MKARTRSITKSITGLRRRGGSKAFSRIELLAVCAAIGLLALVAAPAITLNKADTERLICFNNLRLIGRGIQTWAGDHNQQFSWRTPQSEGGLLPESGVRPGTAWFEYTWLSNELVTPKILACPSDTGVLKAREWAEFVWSPFRGNAVSYPLSLDGSIDIPQTWLSADRNFPASAGGSCSARVNNVYTFPIVSGLAYVAWTNAVHGEFGHVLTTGGAVEFTSTSRLREMLASPGIDDNGATHFVKAR